MDILSQYVMKYPADQNILDIFANEWSSVLPRADLSTRPGNARLFEDARIQWAAETLGGFAGLKVLELGPLEGGHSYMLQQAGAREVLAIEANTRSFLKCLCIKEIFGLDKVHFKLGDFMPFLEQNQEKFDVMIASGVLYHMPEPLRLLELIAAAAQRVFIWTHYYDAQVIAANPNLKHKFKSPEKVEYHGCQYELCEQSYKDALNWAGFCGGAMPTSKWLAKDSLIQCLQDFGFDTVYTHFDDPQHPNGPALALCALKLEAVGKPS